MGQEANDTDVAKSVTDVEKRLVFERFLTYRRRMARLCAVQGMYLYDANKTISSQLGEETPDVPADPAQKADEISDAVLYFYRNVFFDQEYADKDEKHSKIDEKYLREIIQQTLEHLPSIDKTISQHLNERWTLDKIEMPIRAILRCGVSEVLYNVKTDIPILTSEYTNMTSCFFSGKQIGFVNGIVDKIAKTHRK